MIWSYPCISEPCFSLTMVIEKISATTTNNSIPILVLPVPLFNSDCFNSLLTPNLLNKKGYNIARRTVAKYREQMHISVARLRKKI